MSAWSDEYAPPSLVALGQQVRAALGLSATAIGIKGNEDHDYGYHRSRRWILADPGSRFGRGDYSVTSPLDQGGDQNWLAALDVTPRSVEQMIAVSKRLDAALRADLLPNVREFYGNVDGDQWVDGWDDLTHRVATSDDSHLWHFHLSFYRSRAGADHTDVLRVITGAALEDDMSEAAEILRIAMKVADGVAAILNDAPAAKGASEWNGAANGLRTRLERLEGKVGAPLSPEQFAALKAEMLAALPTVAEIATAVADENARRQLS